LKYTSSCFDCQELCIIKQLRKNFRKTEKSMRNSRRGACPR
jgi:hypothetical protein